MSRLVVVGDALLDRDIAGTVQRLAPDAPVPVVDRTEVAERAGGAGLAATLAARDGHEVALVAAVGVDDAGRRLTALLGDAGVDVHGLPLDGSTPVKTRIGTGDRPLVRLDEGDGRAADVAPGTARTLEQLLAGADAVLVADYGRGVAALPDVRAALARAAAGTPLVWDPHPKGAEPVANAALVTPNSSEAAGFCPDLPGEGLAAAARRAAALVTRWSVRSVAMTRGAEGALLSFGPGTPMVVPAPRVSCVDSCGAGDRFAASATAALAAGAVLSEAVAEAVQAASGFVAAGGARAVAGASAAAVADATGDPWAVVRRVRAAGGTVVATGGCFDLLHAGHAATLEAARALGDCLVVCLNSDASVRRLKGSGRPVVGQHDRAALLRSLRAVDAVAVFDEDTPHRLLERLRPDVWVKGGDYTAGELPETALVESWGGSVVVVPYVAGRSTTRLVGLLQG